MCPGGEEAVLKTVELKGFASSNLVHGALTCYLPSRGVSVSTKNSILIGLLSWRLKTTKTLMDKIDYGRIVW